MVLLFIITGLFILYGLLIIYYWLAWRSIPGFRSSSSLPQTKISVIIPARNEEKNIGLLLDALQNQNYPKELFEILVIDDHSEDQTAIVVRQYPAVKLIQLPESAINS